MSAQAVPVATVGFGWTPLLLTIANLLLGGVVVAIIKSWPAIKKIGADREANLLTERAEDMASMREELRVIKTEMAAKDRLHEAQRAADRHKINNLNGAFQALLLLLKKGVSVEEAVAEIEAMRTEQLAREANEAAAIRAAAIKAGLSEPE